MPRRTTPEEDEALLRARGTHPSDRATGVPIGDDRKLAQLFRPFVAPKPGPAPWVSRSAPLPFATDQRPRVRRGYSYSAAFQPGFFAYGPDGYSQGRQRAIWLRDTAKTIQREGYGTAVLIVEHQKVGRGKVLIAGINGSFNPNQYAMLDQLQIFERYNLRDRNRTQGHPDVVIASGQIGGTDSDAVAIGSSIPFCRICLRQIDGAGFELIPDANPYEAVAPQRQPGSRQA